MPGAQQLPLREAPEDPDVELPVVQACFGGDRHPEPEVRPVRHGDHERAAGDDTVVELHRHARRPIAQCDPDRPRDGHGIALVDPADLAEDRGVHADRTSFEEGHHAGVPRYGLTRVDGPDLTVAEDVGSDVDVALDPEGAGDVHDAAKGQDAEHGLRPEEVLGDEMDGAVAAGRDDDLDTIRDRLADDRPGLVRIDRRTDLGVDAVTLEDPTRSWTLLAGRSAVGRPAAGFQMTRIRRAVAPVSAVALIDAVTDAPACRAPSTRGTGGSGPTGS